MKKILLYYTCLLFLSNCIAQTSAAKSNDADTAYFCVPCKGTCDDLHFDKPGICAHCGMKLMKMSFADRRIMMSEKPISIGFYLQDGVEVLDFAGPMEVFSYAGFKVITISKTKNTILSQGILKITPDYSIDDAPPTDILAFFGGNAGAASMDKDLIKWIEKNKPTTKYHFSVCTGAFILGKAGVLEGKTATTFHSSIESLKSSFPNTKVLANVRYVDNGKVITTAGISAGIDGALYLVSKLKGAEAAKNVAEYMEYDKYVPDQGLIIEEIKN